MPYVSPIPLLSEAQRAQFPDIDLKKIRNEILLHFQFSAEPVVEIHGQYYDKDEVVTLLDILQTNPGLHWTIYQHPAILELLEGEDLQKFNQIKAINAIDQHPEYAEAIHDLLIDVINHQLPEHILHFTWETTTLLVTIQNYTSRRTAQQQAVAYSNTYSTFRSFTESLITRYPEPFVSPGNFSFIPDLESILQREVLKFFKYLPQEFNICLHELGTWCNNHVVLLFVREQSHIASWPRESLKLVIEAAMIAAETFNREGNMQVVNHITNYLEHRVQTRSNPWRMILFAIGVFIFLMRVGTICSRQENRNARQRYDSSRDIKISNERMQDALAAQGFQFDEKGRMVKVDNKGLQEMRRLNGTDPIPSHLITYLDKTWNKKDSILTLRFETEVIPKGTNNLRSFITSDLLSDVAGHQVYIDLKFVRKGLKGAAFTHRFLHEKDGSLKIIRGKIEDINPSGTITLLPLGDVKRYKGMVSISDLEGDILDRDTLGLKLKPNTSYKQVVYNGFTNGTLSVNDSTSLHIRGVRSTCLLGMIGAVEQLTLKNQMEAKLQHFATYGFTNENPVKPDALNHSVLARTRSEQRVLVYTYTSAADHIAYCELDGGVYNVRYMFDTSTGEMLGCQLVQISEDRQYVEKIEMFKTK